MAKFLTGNSLNIELERIFESAQKQIIIISPFIKLHNKYASVLREKMINPEVEIILVFGKNEDNLPFSFGLTDFNFFKEFPNIKIRYEKRLHAKYYANEKSAVLTSMNLHRYSQENNIEAGIAMKTTSIATIASTLIIGGGDHEIENDSMKYFSKVITQSDLVFERTPEYENKMFGFSNKYTNSITVVDKLSEVFKTQLTQLNLGHIIDSSIKKVGFCIRTGVEIPYNIKRPFSYEAYKSFMQNGNENKEKYCHFSGELSLGETNFNKPVLNKNWKKAKNNFETN